MDTNKLVDEYLGHAESEQPKIAKAVSSLSDDAREAFGKVLAHFDYKNTQTLDDDERQIANRVLVLLHKPTAKSLDALLQVFTYMDCDESQSLEHTELTLAVEVLEMFAKADSVNNTLSVKELNMLLAVLENLDGDSNGVLDEGERRSLRDNLWDADAFLAEQREKNEKLAKLMG
jgi:hypothetical protein